MMEQTTNSFTKGLQMDVHPMVAGKDSYTDCLNGTITTLHGNEVILQNDMGNRRVDNAFLPAGYQPVGIKEYGGIIYVASYNPITNKSQLGSFPSPQRKISVYDDDTLKFDGNINFNTSNIDGWGNVQFLTTDSYTVTLTQNTFLHAGDKFIVYGIIEIDGQVRGRADLTNYENIWDNGHIVHSPKNKRYTLSLGVLDSKHQFSDITSSLERWDVMSGEYKMLENISDENPTSLYKFNKGYFIAPQEEIPIDDTIDDSKLIEVRKLLAANTYAYKLNGPLSLQFTYNHINNVVDYNITGEKLGDGLYDLTVEATLQYNCPDGVIVPYNDTSENISSDYHTYENNSNVTEVLNGFDLYDLDRYDQFCDSVEVNYGIPEYDSSAEDPYKYKVIITKTYRNVTPSVGTTFNYIFAVGEKNKYLSGLSQKGTIDLNKIGSGTIEINTWKYIWNDENKNLNVGVEAYARKGTKFANLKIEIGNITIYKETTLGFQSGFNESIQGLDPQKVYKAKISYDVLKDGVYTSHVYDDGYIYWILTTGLFNEHYNNFNGTLIQNFAKLKDSDGNIKGINEIYPEETYSLQQEWIRQKLIIGPNFITKNSPVILNKNSSIIGSKLSKENQPIKVIGSQTINFSINTNVNLGVDKKLYPDYLVWEETFDSSQIQIDTIKTKSNIDEIKDFYSNNIISNPKDLEIDINEFVSESLNIENGIITGNITWNDIHKYNSMQLTGTIKKAFDTADKYFTKVNEHESDYCDYFGFSLKYNDGNHYIALIKNNTENYYNVSYNTNEVEVFGEKIMKFGHQSGGDSPNIDNYWTFAHVNFDEMFDRLPLESASKNFAYIYTVDPNFILWYGIETGGQVIRSTLDQRKMFGKSRLYWKDINGNWALVGGKVLYNTSGNFVDQFKEMFGSQEDIEKLTFCSYNATNDYTLYQTNLSNYIYYNNRIDEEHNLWYKLYIYLNLGDNVNFVSNLRPENSILNFSVSNSDYYTSATITQILSNNSFWDYIERPLDMELIDIEHGLNVDSDGHSLNEENVYIYSNNQLTLSNIPVGSRSDKNSERQLACKSSRNSFQGYSTDYYYRSEHIGESTALVYYWGDSVLSIEDYNIRSVSKDNLKLT